MYSLRAVRTFWVGQSSLAVSFRYQSFHILPSKFVSQTSQESSGGNDDFLESDEPKPLTEEEILAKRNKSRLLPHQYKFIHGENPNETPFHWYHNTLKYRRRMYARYGEKSGINPGIQWPTHEDLNKRLEYEKVAYPFTIQEMVANVKEKRRLEKEYFDKRTKELEVKVGAIEKTIKEVLDKRAAKELEVRKSQEKKEKLMEEVRRHFGYTMDPKDDRFKELVEQKEKEEKKKVKEARKLEKQARMLEKVKQMSSGDEESAKSRVKPQVEANQSSTANEEEWETTESANRNVLEIKRGLQGTSRNLTGQQISTNNRSFTKLTGQRRSIPNSPMSGSNSPNSPPSSSGNDNFNGPSNLDPHEVVEADLRDVVTEIKNELKGRHPELCEVAGYYFDGQGKAVRPLIAVLMARAINFNIHKKDFLLSGQKQLALVSEMIHTATLVHDDVIDTSSTRRGKQSANALFGQKKAIIGGDYILAKSGAMIARLDNDEVTQILAQVLEDLVQGEFMQMGADEGNSERFEHYIGKTFKKTASLMAYSCKGVAILGGADETLIEIAFQYGRNLGIAFQLVDDLLDFVSSTATMGKPAAADLQLGLATAPVLYAAEKYPELEELIERRFSEEGDVQTALDRVHNSDGLERTKLLAKTYCAEAVRYAAKLVESPYRQALINVTDKVLNRSK